MKVLIFGNSGFIGSKIENYLSSKKIETFGISNSIAKSDFHLDICDYQSFNDISFIPDVVINCASLLPVNNALNNPSYVENVFKVNTLGALNIANWAKEKNIKRVFNLSTLVVSKKPWKIDFKETDYELPDGNHVAYCMSKISQERLMFEVFRDSATKFTNIRLSAVYGDKMKHEGILFSLFDKTKINSKIELTNGESTSFNFIHVNDIAKIFHILIQSDFDYDIINLASLEEIKLIELAHLIKTIAQSKSEIVNIESVRIPSFSNINVDRLKTIIDVKFEFTSLIKGLTKLYNDEVLNNG